MQSSQPQHIEITAGKLNDMLRSGQATLALEAIYPRFHPLRAMVMLYKDLELQLIKVDPAEDSQFWIQLVNTMINLADKIASYTTPKLKAIEHRIVDDKPRLSPDELAIKLLGILSRGGVELPAPDSAIKGLGAPAGTADRNRTQ